MKALLIIGSVALAGCLGQAADGAPLGAGSFSWVSQITVTPDAPTAGRHVSLGLHLVSHSTDTADTDVSVRVIHASGRRLYQQTWTSVLFHPEEVWDLNQGFLPATDDRGTARIAVTLTDHATGQVLWQDDSATVTLR